jgi:hypothetical protein
MRVPALPLWVFSSPWAGGFPPYVPSTADPRVYRSAAASLSSSLLWVVGLAFFFFCLFLILFLFGSFVFCFYLATGIT